MRELNWSTAQKTFLLVFAGLLFALQPAIADQDIDLKLLQDIPNVVFLQEDVIGGGVPSKEALAEIKLWKEKLNVKGANVKQYEELIRLAEKNVAISKSQREVLGRIKNEVKVTLDSFTDFVRSTAVQYNYAQQMAKQYKQITRELGANATQAKNIEKSFKGAAPEVLLMGGSLEDMTTMMETFSEETGRARALTKGE